MKKITLLLGGQNRDFHFGIGFLGMFLEKNNIKISEVMDFIKDNPFKAVPELMYCSLLFNYQRSGLQVDFDSWDVAEWIDEAGGINGPEVEQFSNAFLQSMVKDVPTTPDVKKKVTTK
jgi:hypothetical protein